MSSFKKKTGSTKSKTPSLSPGCKPSIHNNQVVISSGVASIDFLLGGGLPLGSLVLIEEDELRTYSDLLLRYFVGEGILSGHQTMVCTGMGDCSEFLRQLPGVEVECTGENVGQSKTDSSGEETMKIALRYEALEQINSEFTSAIKFCHTFDLTQKLDFDTFIKQNPCVTIINTNSHLTPVDTQAKADSTNPCIEPCYAQLIQSIRDRINQLTGEAYNGVIRIALQHLGSMAWTDTGSEGSKQFLQFLYQVRALTRSYPITFLLSYPPYNHSQLDLHRIRHLSDAVYRLECLQSSEKEVSSLFSEYHGLFHLVKLPKINSLQSFIPETLNFGFKAKRKRFMIEKLHLPPELGEDPREKKVSENSHRGAKIDKKMIEF